MKCGIEKSMLPIPITSAPVKQRQIYDLIASFRLRNKIYYAFPHFSVHTHEHMKYLTAFIRLLCFMRVYYQIVDNNQNILQLDRS